MKICAVSYLFPNPDKPILGSYVKEQLEELAKNHEVNIITIGKPHWKVPKEEFIDKIHIHRIIANKFYFPIKCFLKLIELDKKYSFDVLHAHFTGYLTLMAGLAAKIRKKPFFITTYGLSLDPKAVSFFKRITIRWCFKLAKKIISISHYTKSLSENYAPKEKHIVITPGITLSRLRVTTSEKKFRKKNKLENRILLLSVGGLVWRKGHDTIISVLPSIVKKYPSLNYIIIGKGAEEKNLKNQVKDLSLEKNVIFWPRWSSDEELANFYNAIDIFVLMSRTRGVAVEGFGIVYVEANALGKPVIGGKGGGTIDAVANGKSGFLINPDDKEELKNKLILLIKNKKLRQKMGKYGREYTRKNHLWKYKVEQILKVYNEFT